MKKPRLHELLEINSDSLSVAVRSQTAIDYMITLVNRLGFLIARDSVGTYSSEDLDLLNYRIKAKKHFQDNIDELTGGDRW